MPTLPDAKHEKFAQEVAKGKSAAQAYEDAGYAAHRSSASRLLTNVNIKVRVAELQEASAERTLVTVESITADLLRIAQKAEDLKEANGLSVARAARMDAAKLNGLVVDKSENINRNYVARLPQPSKDGDEWRSQHMPSQKLSGKPSQDRKLLS